MTRREAMLKALDSGLTKVFIDPRTDVKGLPEYLTKQPVVRIDLSYHFKGSNISVTADEVNACLSFNKNNFQLTIPLTSILGIIAPGKSDKDVTYFGELEVEKPEEIKPKPSFLRLVK